MDENEASVTARMSNDYGDLRLEIGRTNGYMTLLQCPRLMFHVVDRCDFCLGLREQSLLLSTVIIILPSAPVSVVPAVVGLKLYPDVQAAMILLVAIFILSQVL